MKALQVSAPSSRKSLLAALVKRASTDETVAMLAIDLLRQRQLERADVQTKLAAIQERRRFRG